MKLTKSIVAMAVSAAMSGYAGDSAPFRLDTRTGVRESGGVETFVYSSLWDGDAESKVVIAQNGTNVFEKAGEGEWKWNESQFGTYVFTHTTYTGDITGKVETATFRIVAFCAVTFNANGGSLEAESQTRTVEQGTVIGGLPEPMWAGHSFDGWFTEVDGGDQVTVDTKVAGDVTYYAHWTADGGGGSGGDDVGGGGDAGGDGGSSIGEGGGAGDTVTVQPWVAQKAVVLDGAVYDAEGNVAGVVQLKVAKPNAKKHNAKISGSVTLLDGKKRALKAAAFTVPADAPISANLGVKGLGTLALVIGADGFNGSVGGYTVAGAKVGGNWTRADARVYTVATSAVLPPGTIEDLLPDGEPVRVKGGKWVFDKAASVKYAKGALSGLDDSKKPNLSAMKLTYTPKTGLFKGSFKLYALQGGKLKKFTVKITGVVVDGEGTGIAKLAKPAVTWSVSVR